jgi:hypothetical protein
MLGNRPPPFDAAAKRLPAALWPHAPFRFEYALLPLFMPSRAYDLGAAWPCCGADAHRNARAMTPESVTPAELENRGGATIVIS